MKDRGTIFNRTTGAGKLHDALPGYSKMTPSSGRNHHNPMVNPTSSVLAIHKILLIGMLVDCRTDKKDVECIVGYVVQ